VAEERSELQEIMDRMATEVVMVEPGNLLSLGNILSLLEQVIEMPLCQGHVFFRQTIECLMRLVEKLILNAADPEKSIEWLGEGISVLQTALRKKEEGSDDSRELKSFLDSFLSSSGIKVDIEKIQSHVIEEHASEDKEENISQDDRSLSGDEDSSDGLADELSQDMELYQDFIAEAFEHLQTIEINILSLEQNPEDLECINSIFRPFHTIKGVTGFINLKDINRLSHEAETLLDKARKGSLKITSEIIDLILEIEDVIKQMVHALKENLETGRSAAGDFPVDECIERIRACAEGKADAVEEMEETEEDKPVPRLGEIMVEQGAVSQQIIADALDKQKETPEKKIGQILLEDKGVSPKDVVDGIRIQKKIREKGVGQPETVAGVVKIDTQKLDNLVDMVGELVIVQSQVQENPCFKSIPDPKLNKDISQMGRITLDLQKTAMSMRMVPLQQTFQKMIRVVRDLSRKSGKQVELLMHGEDTEIDRNMVEAIYDPLVHMVRNAVDHGIESPDERKAAGKDPTGRIHLKAYHKGGNVVIEIEDDGRGLDRDKILQKAVTQGLVSETASTSDTELFNLIFHPGFSTAEKVTDISGRGVGMDVVKKSIEGLRGKVEIQSRPGHGSTFLMRLPLTLAIIDGIIVKVGEERYIIPTLNVREFLRPDREACSTLLDKGEMIKVRERLLPLIRLYELFTVSPENTRPWEALVVVVENGEEERCLMVDDLVGKQEVVIKSLGETFEDIKGTSGGTILGDGRVGLILDVNGLFAVAKGNGSGNSTTADLETASMGLEPGERVGPSNLN